MDNSSPDVVLSDPSMWSGIDSAQYYRRSLWYTNQAGASLSFTFDGIAIWYECVSYTHNIHADLFPRYYSDVEVFNGFYTVSIDGSQPERLNGKNDEGQLSQQMLWSKTDLTPGKHTFTLTKDDLNGTYMDLDFFRSVTSEVTE